ncbi:hypothetical protein diail_2647 [Diaporthe ilicicola]|nr:hypothetical protein diail_2647 [Diaporthe ilicicola]
MASVIILIHGGTRHLVPTPADYESLLDVAHAKFRELDGVNDDNIAFHFTPDWFDGEVEMDRGAFSEVQNRAILRITTTARPGGDDVNVQDDACGVPAQHTDRAPSTSGDRSSSDSISLSFIHVPTNRKVSYQVAPDAKLKDTMISMARDLVFHIRSCEFIFSEELIHFFDTPRKLGMMNGDIVEVRCL